MKSECKGLSVQFRSPQSSEAPSDNEVELPTNHLVEFPASSQHSFLWYLRQSTICSESRNDSAERSGSEKDCSGCCRAECPPTESSSHSSQIQCAVPRSAPVSLPVPTESLKPLSSLNSIPQTEMDPGEKAMTDNSADANFRSVVAPSSFATPANRSQKDRPSPEDTIMAKSAISASEGEPRRSRKGYSELAEATRRLFDLNWGRIARKAKRFPGKTRAVSIS